MNRRQRTAQGKRHDALVAIITAIADQIDLHYGNRPGTAERAIYFWYWPPDTCGLPTLELLHLDAQRILADLHTTERSIGDPCDVCTHPLDEPVEVVRGICEPCFDSLGYRQQPPTKKNGTA